MSHNTKTRLWTVLMLLALARAASADAPAGLEVTADDLTAAGVAGVTEVVQAPGRFAPPVKYFRSPERLSEADAKKDCGDCADLIAVYASEVATVPGWNSDPRQQFVRVGARLQLRAYIPAKKRVVTVTAVSEQTMRKISKYLVDKFSK